MGAVLQMSVQLESLTCFRCGVEFAMPVHLLRSLRGNKESFYCPSGHSQAFVESEADRLRKQLADANTEKERLRAMAADAEKNRHEHFEARLAAEKKLKRAKNGVCPCCRRSFTALRRHMSTKHPEWKP